MLTFESALHQVDQRTASHDVLASERVLRLLIKFLDEIDRPRGGGSYNSASSNSSDGLVLKVRHGERKKCMCLNCISLDTYQQIRSVNAE